MQLLNNRYKFEKILGQGGMGKVYLTTDMQTKELVAVKECVANNKKMIERVKREYYFLMKVNHPNIVRNLDFFEFQRRYFIVLEYVEGITLEQLIREHPRCIDVVKQIEIAKKICSAITSLNNVGIVHRDLKPSNIMLQGPDLEPKILDLGIAKSINDELATLTNSGAIIGTPQYMSPEQLDSRFKITESTDVFALGIILYQFFSWQRNSPFAAKNTVATMDKICNLHLPPLSSFLADDAQSKHLSELITYALKKNPKERISSVKELQSALSNKRKQEKIIRIVRRKRFTGIKLWLLMGTLLLFVLVLTYKIFHESTTNKLNILQIKSEKSDINEFESFIAFGMYKQALDLYKEYSFSEMALRDKINMLKKILQHAYKLEIEEGKLEEYYSFIGEEDANVDLAIVKYYIRHKSYSKAHVYLEKMRKYLYITPQQQSEMSYYYGRIFVASQQWEKGEECFANVVESPLNREAIFYSFVCAVELQKPNFPIHKIDSIKDYFKENHLFFEYYGRFLLQKHRWEEAKVFFIQCLKLMPNSGKYHAYSAQCYANLDNFEEAFYHIKIAFGKQEYNSNTLNIAASLISKYPEQQSDILKLISSYIQVSFAKKKPQLYANLIEQHVHLYKHYYDKYSKLSRQTFNEQLIAKLVHNFGSKRKELKEHAYKGVLIFRHTANFFYRIEKMLGTYPKLVQQAANSFLQRVKKQTIEERIKAYQYLMAKSQQNYNELIHRELRLAKNEIGKILEDNEHDVFLRYLAARTLIQTGNWEKVYDLCLQRGVLQVISNAALHDEGFFPELPDLDLYYNNSHVLTIFLQSILERKAVSSKCIVFLERALDHPSLRVRILAAIGLDKWSLSPGRKAIDIMSQSILHPNISIRYLANFYLWQSNIVRSEPHRFAKIYNKLLRNAKTPEVTSVLMLAPQELYKKHVKAFSQLFWRYHEHALGLKIVLFIRYLDNHEPVIEKIMKSEVGQQNTFMRIMLSITPVTNSITDAGRLFSQKNPTLYTQKLKEAKTIMAKLYQKVMSEKFPEVRAAIYHYCADFGYYGMKYLKQDKACQEHILLNLCYKQSPKYSDTNAFSLVEKMISGKSRPFTQQEKQVIYNVIRDKNRELSVAVVLGRIFFEKNGLQKQLQIVERALKNDYLSTKQRKIYAKALYLYIRMQIKKSLPFVIKFYGLDSKDYNFTLISQLQKIARNERIANTYLNILNNAIELDDVAIYRHFRSVIYAEKKFIAKYRQDLQKIILSDVSYYINLALLAKNEQQPQRVIKYLKKLDPSQLGEFNTIRLAELYEYTSQITEAKNVLKQSFSKNRGLQSILLLKILYTKDEAKYSLQLENILKNHK